MVRFWWRSAGAVASTEAVSKAAHSAREKAATENERGRARKLILCQIGCELCLAASLVLIHRHGYEFIAKAEEAAHGKDNCRHDRMVEIDQHVFYLADGRVALVDLAATSLLALALRAKAASSMPAIGAAAFALAASPPCIGWAYVIVRARNIANAAAVIVLILD